MNSYKNIRNKMAPGDVIAFGGNSLVSDVIKIATNSPVSHVGIVMQTKLVFNDQNFISMQAGQINMLIESTSLNGFSGVTINRLSERIATYDGSIWWLPLSPTSKRKLDQKAFFDFLLCQDKKPYDSAQAIRSAMDAIDYMPMIGSLTFNDEDFSKLFCSELAAAGLEAGGLIKDINASEVTPADLCGFNIYAEMNTQICGDPQDIPNFNTVDPEGFGM